MSDTIRQLLLERQSRRPIDLDIAAKLGLIDAERIDAIDNATSPIQGPDGGVASLYRSLLGPSMASRILEQYRDGTERTIQSSLNKGDPNQLMRPMISSVMQLDR